MIADTFQSLNNSFSFMVTGSLTLMGFGLLFVAAFCLHRKVSDPDEIQMTGFGISGLFFLGILFLNMSSITDGLGKSFFGEELTSNNYTQSNTTPTVNPIVSEKIVKKYEPLIAKTNYKAYPEKEVDYTQLVIVLSSIVGGALGLVLSIVGISKLRNKIRVRKYQKIVSNVVELNNDFVTLSEHIGTIENCLDDIKTYKVVAPAKTKSLLEGMQNILEHKKQMFNKSVREIHEMQPELKVLGGLV